MLMFALAAMCLIGVLIAAPYNGRLNIYLGLVATSTMLLPRVVVGSSHLDSFRVGITGSQPRVMTYTVGIIAILLISWTAGNRRLQVWPFLVLSFFLLTWALFVWANTPPLWAGVVHLLTAAGAWIAGGAIAHEVARRGTYGDRAVACWIAGIILIQTVISLLQFVGFPIFDANQLVVADDGIDGRVGGTLGHPSYIGKVCFLAAFFVLPLVASPDRVTRRVSMFAIGVSFIPLILSGGVLMLSPW